jgi:predicted nucleic acid-binding protein
MPANVIGDAQSPTLARVVTTGLAAFVAERSDKLPDLRRTLAALAEIGRVIGPVAQFNVVVDANILISEVLWLIKKRRDPAAKSSLQESIVAETIIAYVTSRVISEVEQHLARISDERGIPMAVWTAEWSNYQRLLNIKDPDSAIVAKYSIGQDPDDAPTLALAETISACGILSRDSDIEAMGGRVLPIAFIIEARDYSRNATVYVSLQIGGYGILLGTFNALRLLASAVRVGLAWFNRLPDGIKIATLVALLVAVVHPKSRAAMIAGLREAVAAMSDAGPAMLQNMVEVARTADLYRPKVPEVPR